MNVSLMKTVRTKVTMLVASSVALATLSQSCQSPGSDSNGATQSSVTVDAFADLEILRYDVPGFDSLTLQQKKLAYYLYQAALSGRDIIYDQRGKDNLTVRKTIEAVFNSPKTDKSGEEWEQFKTYAGRFWFSNGAHHHYSNDKFVPECTPEYFAGLVQACDTATLPLLEGESLAAFIDRIQPIIFDPAVNPKMVNLTEGIDHVAQSSNNFYEGVTQQEVDDFYHAFPDTGRDPEWGINSKVVKVDGKVTEQIWKSGAMYGEAIDQIIFWLEKAIPVAENPAQQQALTLLAEYYRTG